MLFSFPRKTFNKRLSQNKWSEIELLSDHERILKSLVLNRKKELREVLADFKSEQGLEEFLMVEFYRPDGTKVPKSRDKQTTKFGEIRIKITNDIPSVCVVVDI